MALDAAIHVQDSFGYFFKEFYTLGGGGANGGGANGGWGYGYGFVLQEEKVEIDNAHHPTGFTNLMRSENFSNILISTDDNDMNSISSSLKSSKLNFDGKTPPSASLTASTTKGTKKEYSKSSLLKRLFGYK